MTTKSKKTQTFQTEVSQILDMMINSLYSHREIFLRELISNSSDALDKLRFEETKNPEIAIKDKHIRLEFDKNKNTISILDNGIGMTSVEVEKSCTDVIIPESKDKLEYKLENSSDTEGYISGKGNIFAPFSLFSSSVNAGLKEIGSSYVS